MARTVAGTLLLPNGQPMMNARIYFVSKRTETVSIVEGANASFLTSAVGAYSQSIVNGYYSVSIEVPGDSSGTTPRRFPLGDAVVETAATTTLEALLVASNPPENLPVNLLLQIAANAQASADSASASASAAAASAASISVGTGLTQLPNNTILNARLGTTGNLGTAAQRTIGTGATNVPDTAQLNTRLGTAGNLGTIAQQNSNAVSITGGAASGLSSLSVSGNTSSANFTGPLIFPISSGAGAATALTGGVRAHSAGNYDYGVIVNSAFGGIEYHANQVTAGMHRWYSGAINNQQLRMTLDAGGLLKLEGGVSLVNAAISSANVLDWYEEGSFTPNVIGETSAGSATFVFRTGRYTRIGNRVFINISLSWTGHSGTGAMLLSGLPFVSAAGTDRYHSFFCFRGPGIASGTNLDLQSYLDPSSSSMKIGLVSKADGSRSTFPMSANGQLIISGHYEV